MERFWSCFLILIFNASIWINTVVSEGPCDHRCIKDRKCKSMFVHNRCFYVFVDQSRSWEESSTHCEAQGLSMAKMDNTLLRENNYYSTLINNAPHHLKYSRANNKAWLGGRAFNFSTWSYSNGTTVYKWQLNLWRNLWGGFNIAQQWAARELCGYFLPRGSNFRINIQDCDNKGYFLCRKNNCDVVTQRDCLTLVMEQKPWFEARSHCIRIGGDLFYLKENEVLASVLYRGSQIYSDISSIIDSIHVHIGIVHREWKWNSPETDGEGWSDGMRILDTNWAPGEPNRYDQGCLMMYGDTGKWNDNNCEKLLLTFCQKEIEVSTTAEISSTNTIKQTDTKLGQGGSTSPSGGQSTTTLPSSTTLTTASQGDPNTNLIVIILGSLLSLALLIIATGCICWKRGLLKLSLIKSSNNNASSEEIPQEQSSATGVYHYIRDDELPVKPAAPTVVYQNVSSHESHDKQGLNLHPPENGTKENGTPQDAPQENNNYQHLIKR